MSEATLEDPPFLVTLSPGYNYEEAKTLKFRCRDLTSNGSTIIDETGQELFRVKAARFGKTWSFRRSLFNAADEHVLDFRHFDLDIKNRWVVENSKSEKCATVEHASFFTSSHSNVDMTVFDGKDGTDDVLLKMRQVDQGAITTTVSLMGSTVAEITLLERNDLRLTQGGKDATVWKLRVAPKMDLSLIVVLALCRAEMAHVWSQ